MPADPLHLTCLACGRVNRLPADRLADRPKCAACAAPLAGGEVAAIDLARLEAATRTDGLPLMVDFWAPWCGPCRAMAPEFARAAQALAPRVRAAKIDTERHPDAAIRWQIRGIPAIVLFRDGREAARLAGARPAADLVGRIEAALAAA